MRLKRETDTILVGVREPVAGGGVESVQSVVKMTVVTRDFTSDLRRRGVGLRGARHGEFKTVTGGVHVGFVSAESLRIFQKARGGFGGESDGEGSAVGGAGAQRLRRGAVGRKTARKRQG